MQTHTDLLNLIAKKIGAKSYLEIGVFNKDHNFNKIEVETKVGVDPDPKAAAGCCMTSDIFFHIFRGIQFDLIFIDGLHHADQVIKDLENAYNVLNAGGVIIIHDSNPPTEITTCVPRGTQREWCGDVYKAVAQISSPKFTVDFDYGCCIVRKEKTALGPTLLHLSTDVNTSWEEFNLFRGELLNLVTIEVAETIINNWK